MFSISANVRIFLYNEFMDMRNSFEGLSGAIEKTSKYYFFRKEPELRRLAHRRTSKSQDGPRNFERKELRVSRT